MTPVQAPRIDPRYACFDIGIRRSKIHRYGVYANERIPANRKVMEYTGARINRQEAAAIESGEYTSTRCSRGRQLFRTLDGARGGQPVREITSNHTLRAQPD